ncbi:MAG: hypothetical protein Q9207_008169 [Kuettlingeria erythrocarpa]
MQVPTTRLWQAAIVFSLLLLTSLKTHATAIQRRADCCLGECPDDENGNQSPTLDGPTGDKSPGLGVEFEAQRVVFRSGECDKASTDSSKGKMVGGRQGKNWKLTADTTLSIAGRLVAEYILDGTQIKLGAGTATEAASLVANDFTSWDPSAAMDDNGLDVEDSTCNPWSVVSPDRGGAANSLQWALQVTAPLPLEAISDLFDKAVKKQTSALLPDIAPERRMVHVSNDFFQSNPNGISSDAVTDDVLGFFSLVMSYAKGARQESSDTSPKEIMSIMPRTDFTNIFSMLEAEVTGDLYDLVKKLACYRNSGDTLEIDERFCSGPINDPQPNGQMDRQAFTVSSPNGQSQSCTVQEWIKSIQDKASPDRLSELDQVIDGSIGGLKDVSEYILGTNQPVPLFEFRRLAGVKAGDMEKQVGDAEQAVIDYHTKYASAKSRRFAKRAQEARSVYSKRKNPCVPSQASSPSPASELTCFGVETTKWMGRDALNQAIGTFCQQAEEQGVQDKDSGSLVRNYNDGGPDQVTLSMDWPSGSSFKPSKGECTKHMAAIMDSCDGNDPDHNPLNWKHGGWKQVAEVRYNVLPSQERYKAGTCSMHIHEKESFVGIDGPGTQRFFTYHLDVDAKDADGHSFAGTEKGQAVEAGDKNPYVLNAYYQPMEITPEAQDGDYIQFTLGDQSWRTSTNSGTPRCEVGDWDSDFTPLARDMDCFFFC